MKRTLLFACALLLVPALASAQSWQYAGTFPATDTVQTDANGMHGIAVDPDGKVWLQPFGGTRTVEFTDSILVGSTVYKSLTVREIFVYEADGTPASFSPIFAVGEEPGDTLGLFYVGLDAASGKEIYDVRSGRGMASDADGNIIVSQFDTIFKLDYKTGQKLGKVVPSPGNALTAAGTDSLGNIFTSHVFPGLPVQVFNSDLEFVEVAVEATANFARSINVSADGLRIYETDYENTYTILHERVDEFSAFDSVGVAFMGMRTESSAFNPATGNIWVSSGNPLNSAGVVEAGWELNTYYEFDPADLSTPLESFTWEPDGSEGRPRGMAFSPDGMKAYAVQFSNAPPNVQVFEFSPSTAIERVGDDLPTDFSLDQNYPNPFNPSTTIAFDLAKAGQARLAVYDALGREVRVLVDEYMPAGQYTTSFEATSQMPSGTYLYVLDVDGQRVAKRMLLLK